MPEPIPASYHFGDFQLNLNLRVLVREGRRVPIGPKAYDVLACLAAHRGNAVSKAELLKHVWPGAFVEEGTLTQHIFSLRKALGDKASCIVTVPGFGYRLATEVYPAPEEAAQAWHSQHEDIVHEVRERTHVVFEEPMPPVHAAAKPVSRIGRKIALAAGILISLGAFAGWTYSHRATPPDFVGVVVADFTNSTNDPTFDRALKRALEIDLSQSPYMSVMGGMEGVSALGLMGMKPDTTLTPQIAREICERTNRQVLLSGTISSIGDRYLLTLEATDCHSGKKLASSKATALDKGKVLEALDTIAEKDRSRLGESASSLQHYEVPIADGATPSLDALKAYSMGVYLLNQGKIGKEAAPFFKQAIDLDPHFASAYGELASAYYNMQEPQLAGEYTQKLCALDAHVGERTRLAIASHCEKDAFAQIKVFQMWTEEYPHDWIPWLDIANLYNDMDQPDLAIPAGQHALHESGGNQISYAVLIRSYMYAQRFAEAKNAEVEAVKRGKDSDETHHWMFMIAHFELNAADIARETHWAESKKAGLRFYYAAEAAAMDGQFHRAEELFDKELEEDRQLQETELADSVLVDKAAMERQLGRSKMAQASLAHASQPVHADPGVALEHAMEGDTAFAEHFLSLQKEPAKAVQDVSEIPYTTLPQLHAAEATQRSKPLEAIADLNGAWPLIPTFTQRAAAYLSAGQPKLAEAQYQAILARPAVLIAVDYPLAHLGLARAYAMEADTADSRKEYETFLNLWKSADPDIPVLNAAKAELAHLSPTAALTKP